MSVEDRQKMPPKKRGRGALAPETWRSSCITSTDAELRPNVRLQTTIYTDMATATEYCNAAVGWATSSAEGLDLLVDSAATHGALLELSGAVYASAVVSARDERAVDFVVHAHLRAKTDRSSRSSRIVAYGKKRQAKKTKVRSQVQIVNTRRRMTRTHTRYL